MCSRCDAFRLTAAKSAVLPPERGWCPRGNNEITTFDDSVEGVCDVVSQLRWDIKNIWDQQTWGADSLKQVNPKALRANQTWLRLKTNPASYPNQEHLPGTKVDWKKTHTRKFWHAVSNSKYFFVAWDCYEYYPVKGTEYEKPNPTKLFAKHHIHLHITWYSVAIPCVLSLDSELEYWGSVP